MCIHNRYGDTLVLGAAIGFSLTSILTKPPQQVQRHELVFETKPRVLGRGTFGLAKILKSHSLLHTFTSTCQFFWKVSTAMQLVVSKDMYYLPHISVHTLLQTSTCVHLPLKIHICALSGWCQKSTGQKLLLSLEMLLSLENFWPVD